MSQGSEAAEQMTREAVKLSEEAVKLSKNNRRERKDLRAFGDSLAERQYTEHQ